jgi:hypothetical protein
MLDVIILEDDPEVCRILVHAAETDGNRASAYDNIQRLHAGNPRPFL